MPCTASLAAPCRFCRTCHKCHSYAVQCREWHCTPILPIKRVVRFCGNKLGNVNSLEVCALVLLSLILALNNLKRNFYFGISTDLFRLNCCLVVRFLFNTVKINGKVELGMCLYKLCAVIGRLNRAVNLGVQTRFFDQLRRGSSVISTIMENFPSLENVE